MASSREYLTYVLDLLSSLDEITYKSMMGEYIIYYRGRIIGGIYDDRFLVKDMKASRALLPDAALERPYDGAKEMRSVDSEDRGLLHELFEAMYDELPGPKLRKGRH